MARQDATNGGATLRPDGWLTPSPGEIIPPPVLYGEDDRNDAFFMQRAFREAGIANPLLTLEDGAQVIDYLAGHGDYSNRIRFPFPCLLLLDLKLPLKSGFEVLEWICGEARLRSLRVVIVSSSGHEQDMELATSMGISGYLVKPSAPSQLSRFAGELKAKWLEPR